MTCPNPAAALAAVAAGRGAIACGLFGAVGRSCEADPARPLPPSPAAWAQAYLAGRALSRSA